MTTIFERVNSALATLNPAVPFALKPYIMSTGANLPNTLIEYQLLDSLPEQHADNIETERSYLVQVTVWDVAGLVTLPNLDAALIAAGFKKSDQRQLPKDPQTGHYGLATDYMYLESS